MNDAAVFLTQIVDGKMQKVNLCEGCSKEKGVQDPTGFALADLLLGIGAAEEIEKRLLSAAGMPTLRTPRSVGQPVLSWSRQVWASPVLWENVFERQHRS